VDLHVIGIGEADGAPRVLTAGGPDGLSQRALVGDFSWTVVGPRTCIGKFGPDGPTACPSSELVGGDTQCLPCSGLEHPECIFEPLCAADPSACECPYGAIPHVVYAAFYGTLPKIGMTQERRITHRLREQGADAYFVVAQCPNRATARRTERAVSVLYGIPEFRSHRETLPQLSHPVAWDLIARRAQELRDRLAARFPVSPTLTTILDHPVAQPLPARPRRRPVVGRHAGSWLGAKGPNLFYLDASESPLAQALPRVVALRAGDLLGHRIRVD
jgi:hypothetical protein